VTVVPDFLLRDLPEELVNKLKARAERNGRSLQAEIRETLRDSTRLSWDEWASQAGALRARTDASAAAPTAVDAIADGHRERDEAIDTPGPRHSAGAERTGTP
jgi:plasmid stability protein